MCSDLQKVMSSHKRKAEEGAESKVEKKAKVEPPELWIVTWTTFIDDYKPRGNDWMDTETDHFASKTDAENFLFNKLHDWVEYRRDGEEDETEWKDAHESLADMESYVSGYTDAEFVRTKLEWSLEQVVLTKAPEQRQPCGCYFAPSDGDGSEEEEEEEAVQDSKSAKS